VASSCRSWFPVSVLLRCVGPRSFVVSVLGGLVLCAGTGCSSRADYPTPVYDACHTVDDCVETATLCEELQVDFAGFTHSNAICTLPCDVEGVLSPDCPRSLLGRFGSCYPSSAVGGIDDTLICFEPCDFDADCQLGFRCLGAEGLCGAEVASCPIDETDAICVPGPY
jgi:hypothetical protein